MISALVAYLTMNVFSTVLMNLPATIIWLILLVPLGLSLGISFKANRNPVAALIMLIFLAAAAVFIAMAIFGTFTKRDLSNWNSYLSAALFGFMVAWLVNLFLRNPAVTYLFSFIGVIIFTGLVASDANKMKVIYNNYGDQLSSNGLAILGALQLYLDFINIFMFLLEIFGGNGNRRN